MFKIIADLFKKKSPSIDTILLYPEGKRYYRDSHIIRKNLIDDDVQKIIHRLNKFGHKSFLVGGCVRDILLGKKPKDFDIVTSATPNQIKNIFNNCRIIGRRFKIVHVIFKNKIIEVSTFRSLPEHRLEEHGDDKDYLLTKDNNYGTPKEDAARRDFTINSLYFDIRNESIIDFVGGFDDLQNKVLKVIGNPDISFKEDPVRMLRAVKFGVLHGLKFDKATQKAIKKNRSEIEKASTSRMLEEYNKIFRTWRTAEIFKGLAENYLLDVLFKEALENIRKQPDWRENFLENTSVGKRLVIADRMLSEREEVNHIIFFTIVFSDIVSSALKGGDKNIVHTIKEAIEPLANRMELPKRDKEKIIKIFTSQQRFYQSSDASKAHIEVFKNKDFFHEAFMFFKINALAENDDKAVQNAFFWEISTTPKNKISKKKDNAIKNRSDSEPIKPKRSSNKGRRYRRTDRENSEDSAEGSTDSSKTTNKKSNPKREKKPEMKNIMAAKTADLDS